jgi:hypothetical protein
VDKSFSTNKCGSYTISTQSSISTFIDHICFKPYKVMPPLKVAMRFKRRGIWLFFYPVFGSTAITSDIPVLQQEKAK